MRKSEFSFWHYLSTLDFWDTARPYMEELVEQVHESCSAAVLDEFDVVYVARVPTTKRSKGKAGAWLIRNSK